MLDRFPLVGFAATTDVAAARAFYGGVLGLELVEDSPYGLVYRAPGTTLRVTVVERVVPAGYTVLGWDVTDIEQVVTDLAARGVAFARYDGMDQDDLGIWAAPGGARVAWFADPDGNTLSVSEHPAAR